MGQILNGSVVPTDVSGRALHTGLQLEVVSVLELMDPDQPVLRIAIERVACPIEGHEVWVTERKRCN